LIDFCHNFSLRFNFYWNFFTDEKFFLKKIFLCWFICRWSLLWNAFFTCEKKRKKYFFCWEFSFSENFFVREFNFPHLRKNKNIKNNQKVIKIKLNFLIFIENPLNFHQIWENSLKNSTTPLIHLSNFIPGCSFFILFLSILFILSHHIYRPKLLRMWMLRYQKNSLTSPRAFLSVFMFFFLVHLILPKNYVLCSICEYFTLLRKMQNLSLLDEIRMDVINVGLGVMLLDSIRRFKWWIDYTLNDHDTDGVVL
jgi:hypothetical protein